MVRRRGSTWSANRPMTSPDASTDITLVQESQSSSSSLSHIMKRTYSQVFSSTPLDLAFSDDIATIKGKERATSMQKDRRPSNTPPVLPKEASSFRGLVRRASMSVKRQLHPPSKLLKESPARDSSQSIASSSSPLTTLPERRRPSLSQQFKSGLRSLRRHAVSNQSGEEGRWNPSSLPLPQGPPVNSVYPMYPGVPEYRQGQAARASAAAHNTRLQYGVPANSPMHSPFEGSECDSIMGNADSVRTLAMTRQDSVDSLDAANQGSSSPIVRIDPVRTLPTELMWEVLGQLDCATLAGAERVSKSWNRIVKDQAVWQKYYQRRYTAKTYVEPAPIQMGGTGVPTAFPGQDWKKAAFARRTIERRWATGRPAAIYFNGHTDSVYCCQFDEEKIITGSRDRTIRIWDINTGRCLKVIGGPSYIPVASNSPPLPVESSNTVLNVASVNGTPEGREIYHVPEDFHSASILCLQYDEEIMVTGSSDNTCIVWSMKDFQPKFRLRRHSAGVLDVCLDDKHIISCSKDQKICVWDRRTGALIKELTGHTGPVNAVQLRGHLLVSASGDGIAKLWDLNSMTCIRDFSSKDRGLAAVEFSDDTKYVLAGGNDQVVYKFDTENGELVHTYQGHTGLVRSLFLDAFNDVVISGSYDQSLRIYNYTTGKLYGTFENWTTSWILSAKSDYRRCVCTSQDGRALMLDFGYKVKGAEILKSMS